MNLQVLSLDKYKLNIRSQIKDLERDLQKKQTEFENYPSEIKEMCRMQKENLILNAQLVEISSSRMIQNEQFFEKVVAIIPSENNENLPIVKKNE